MKFSDRLRKIGAARYLLFETMWCSLSAFLLLFLSEAIALQSFSRAFLWLSAHADAAGAAVLFLAALIAFLAVLLRFRAAAVALPAILTFSWTLVSYYKTVINGFPLLFSDLRYAPHAASIFSFALPRVRFSAVTALSCLLAVCLAALPAFFAPRLPRRAREQMLLLSLSLPLVLSYAGPGIFLSHAAALSADCATQEERNALFGELYGFYCTFAAQRTATDDAAEPEAVRGLVTDEAKAGPETVEAEPEVLPDIIFVLSESFFDITRWDFLHFEEDPLPNLHRLARAGESGTFLSSTYAGGTGNVEMEMLTGLLGSFLDEADMMTSLTREGVYENMPSIPRLLRDSMGYDTLYIHSYTNELFNRVETLPALGFDEVVFLDGFLTDWETDGLYPSDHSAVREVMERLDRHGADAPLFVQLTTMENHQPYTAEKYGIPFSIPYTSDIELDKDSRAMLDALLIGLNHADAALGELADALARRERPAMLVFYGDHMPSMAVGSDVSDGTFFSHVGMVPSADTLSWNADTIKMMMSTDYVICSTEGGEAGLSTQSASLLGVHALRRAHIRLTPFYDWLCDSLSRELLMLRPRLCVTGDGTAYQSVPDSVRAAVNEYRTIARDLIYGEGALRDLTLPQTAAG